MEAQAMQALDNLDTVVREAGFELSDIARLNVYVTDVEAYREAAPALGARLARCGVRQAATLLGVARLARPELLIEIEATAVR
jgi:enamine deaminase RidA (YjgF/YER057c/UK114 family)